jgi:SAM-dependent methyltransferase
MVYFDYKNIKPVIVKGMGGNITPKEVTDKSYQIRYKNRNIEKLELIKNFIPSFTDLSILDVGCNSGFFSIELNKLGAFVNGIDIDETLISEIKNFENKTLKFNVASVEEIAEQGVSFNIILFMSVYHHLINLRGLDKAREILRKLATMSECLIFESGQRDEDVSFEWKNKLPEKFSTSEDIFEELEQNTNFEKFHLLGKLPIHGGNRNIFLCTR